MYRHARAAILTAICASVATPPEFGFSHPERPQPTRSVAPRAKIRTASLARLQRQSEREEGTWRSKLRRYFAPPVSNLVLDVYPHENKRFQPVLLGGKHDVSSTGTRIRMTREVGRGAYGTVIAAEYRYFILPGSPGILHTIAVKRMLSAKPKEVLNDALRECGAMRLGSLKGGVVPCYGVVVGRNITDNQIESVLSSQASSHVHFTADVPVAVGLWSDNHSKGWNVALLLPWLEGVVDGDAFGDAAATPTSNLHAKLALHRNWPLVPSAIVACVTRAAKFLLDNMLWNRDMKASNILLTPGFAEFPFDPQNCLLSDFGFTVSLNFEGTNVTGSLSYMHPLIDEINGVNGASSTLVHHVTDVFGLAVVGMQMLTAYNGHPAFRCTRRSLWDEVEKALTRERKRVVVDTPKLVHDACAQHAGPLAMRVAKLSGADLLGMGVMLNPNPCWTISRLVLVGGLTPTQPEGDVIVARFKKLAHLYGWLNNNNKKNKIMSLTELWDNVRFGKEKVPIELTQLARLFQLTSLKFTGDDNNDDGKSASFTGEIYCPVKIDDVTNIYDDILGSLVPVGRSDDGSSSPAVPT